jgi:hypothetical protein
MHEAKAAGIAALKRIRDLLLDVGVRLERVPIEALPNIIPEMDLNLRESWKLAEGCRRLFILHREPVYTPYDPVEVLRRHSGECRLELDGPMPAGSRSCLGDSEQVLECIRLLRDNVTLGHKGSLRTEIVTEGSSPRVLLALGGKGTLPTTLQMDGLYQFDIDMLGRRWTAATNGGHMAITESAVLFYLEGDREVPVSLASLEETLHAVIRLARLLSSWRGAIGHYEPGMVSCAEIQSLYRDTVVAGMTLIDEALGNPQSLGSP